MRATVSGETSRLLRLVERLEELGCSTRITSAGGSWVVNLRSALPPTDLLPQAVRTIGREFPGAGISSLVLEAGGRRYRAPRAEGRAASGLRPGGGARLSEPRWSTASRAADPRCHGYRELGDSLQRLPRSSALKIASSTMFTAQMMIVAQTASMKLPIEKGPTIQLVM